MKFSAILGARKRAPLQAILVVALLCAAGVIRAQSVDFLLMAADDQTLAPIRAVMVEVHHETRAAWEFWVGRLGAHQVVVTRSEGDPLNAVAATTLAIRRHPPRLVIVFGSARPLEPGLGPGDLVVSSGFVPFDGMISQHTALDGGSNGLTWQVLPHLAMAPGETEQPTLQVPADPAAQTIALHLKFSAGRVVSGLLGSAPQVNREADRIAWIHQTWKASTEDGESAPIAASAALLGVPTVGFRVVGSDPVAAARFTLEFLEAVP